MIRTDRNWLCRILIVGFLLLGIAFAGVLFAKRKAVNADTAFHQSSAQDDSGKRVSAQSGAKIIYPVLRGTWQKPRLVNRGI